MSFNASAPHHDTANNHGPLVNVMTWWFVVTSFLAISARFGTKVAILKKLSIDDGMIVLSLLFSIGQTVATNLEVSNGLGQHINTLSTSQIVGFQKSLYSANILSLGSQCFAKLSLIVFIRSLSPVSDHLRYCSAITIGIIVWIVSSILVVLFQCKAPETWNFIDNSKCIDRTAFWNYSDIVNIILDLSLVILPITLVWNLRVGRTHKAVVMACFSTRIITIGAIIASIVLTNKAKNTTDSSFDYWPIVLAVETTISLSIITACIPYLKPFLESLQSGMIRSDDIRRRGGTSTYQSSSSKSKKSAKYFRVKGGNSKSDSHSKNITHELDEIALQPQEAARNIAFVTTDVDGGKKPDWDAESQSSRAKIITQTTTWGVSSTSADAAIPPLQ